MEELRHEITSGELKPGQLFSENEIAKKLGISRTPVRDAINALVFEGLVEQIPQVGIRVREFTESDLQELFEVRQMLEVHATNECSKIAKGNNKIREELTSITDEMRHFANQDNLQLFLMNDIKFHHRVVDIAKLNFVKSIIEQIGNRIKLTGFYSSPTQSEMHEATDEHVAIANGIYAGPEFAGGAMLEHLMKTIIRINKNTNYKLK
ncbi:GntR family transcriptional regulator [Cerasicoccus fimbriatus]|uniref:GntR family transcriptional regulator n=1 Tax=Cerasicoccus fimbriatus TaxID=3014554 RepID=UPI0022B545DD|nr:GntR family transcriptional regulator [Cerasicoccus sp. TK19100]